MAASMTGEMLFPLGSWDFPLSRVEQIHRAIWAYENELALFSQCEGVLVREIQRLQLRVNELESCYVQRKGHSASDAQELPPDHVRKSRVTFAADSLKLHPTEGSIKKDTCGQMQELPENVAADSPKSMAEATSSKGSQRGARVADDQGVNARVSGFANLLSALHARAPKQELQAGGKTRKGEGKSSQLRGKGKPEDDQGGQRDHEPGQGMQPYGQVDGYRCAQAVVTPPPGLLHPSASARCSFHPQLSPPSSRHPDPLPVGLQQPHLRPSEPRREQVFEGVSRSLPAREAASQIPLSGAWTNRGNRSARRGGKGGRSGGGDIGGAQRGTGKRR